MPWTINLKNDNLLPFKLWSIFISFYQSTLAITKTSWSGRPAVSHALDSSELVNLPHHPQTDHFDSSTDLLLSDVALDSRASSTTIQITLKQSRNDQFRVIFAIKRSCLLLQLFWYFLYSSKSYSRSCRLVTSKGFPDSCGLVVISCWALWATSVTVGS